MVNHDFPASEYHSASHHNDNTRTLLSSSIQAAVVPLNEPPIRMWELTANSTHYDRMIAAPSNEEMVQFWSGWAGIMLITGVLTTWILIPLVSTPKIRANPFYLYLIFLMIPDMLVAWICGVTCLTNALAGHFTSTGACLFQSFYMIAAIGANSWINLLVTRQLYNMLSAAHEFRRYTPPRRRQVILECLLVYLYSLVLATLGIVGQNLEHWPHKTRLTIGTACIPMDYDTTSTIFFYCVFFPLLFGIPLAYVVWAAYQIWRRHMLPPTGRRRILAIYFFRLAAAFLIMWLPGLLLLFVTSAWLDPWVQWAGGAWSHLQGMVSALVSLLKPDVWKAVKVFWKRVATCTCCDATVDSASSRDSFGSRRRSSILSRRPWSNSSVYWSPMIVLRASSRKKTLPNNNRDDNNTPDTQKSRVSFYQEKDDDIEAAGKLVVSRLEQESNILVSDESLLLVVEEDEHEPENHDNNNNNNIEDTSKGAECTLDDENHDEHKTSTSTPMSMEEMENANQPQHQPNPMVLENIQQNNSTSSSSDDNTSSSDDSSNENHSNHRHENIIENYIGSTIQNQNAAAVHDTTTTGTTTTGIDNHIADTQNQHQYYHSDYEQVQDKRAPFETIYIVPKT